VGPLLRSLAITLIFPASAASAQMIAPPDTLPFHHGQWAAQFGAGTSFASLGFLRFTAPTRAWLFDFRFSGGHTHSTLHFGDTLTIDDFTSSAIASARQAGDSTRAVGTPWRAFKAWARRVGIPTAVREALKGLAVATMDGTPASLWSSAAFIS
jgi:hypothetical protein